IIFHYPRERESICHLCTALNLSTTASGTSASSLSPTTLEGHGTHTTPSPLRLFLNRILKPSSGGLLRGFRGSHTQ
ncbi:MAG: hypothetical protein ACK53Y_21475, partial [bacterium]